mmetsp:Transcript_50394/g.135676  ORF Transcript_50394/g.135676 Transcript_50394/m.135676 type:complete len:300 (-) Transcript_50394:614-1513(-)
MGEKGVGRRGFGHWRQRQARRLRLLGALPQLPQEHLAIRHAEHLLARDAGLLGALEHGRGRQPALPDPADVLLRVDEAHLEDLHAALHGLAELLDSRILAVHLVVAALVPHRAPLLEAVEAEAVPVPGPGARPLLAPRLVDGEGQQPLWDAHRAEAEAPQLQGVHAALVGVEFRVQQDVFVHLVDVLPRWQHGVLVARVAYPGARARLRPRLLEVRLEHPVIHGAPRGRAGVVEVLPRLPLDLVEPLVNLELERVRRDIRPQLERPLHLPHLRRELHAVGLRGGGAPQRLVQRGVRALR